VSVTPANRTPAPASPAARNSNAPPAGSAREAARAEPALTGNYKSYRVRPNDTIWSIAKATLGNGERWPDIYRINRDVLRDVNRLEVGMVLRLPEDAKLDAADLPQ
jgi:nucleoid-associated protein YgaU